jgi:hypothetical protein
MSMTVHMGAAAFVTLAGLLVYAMATGAKPQELGRLSFACGLLALLLSSWR